MKMIWQWIIDNWEKKICVSDKNWKLILVSTSFFKRAYKDTLHSDMIKWVKYVKSADY